jgi:hypothetical protein
MGEYAYSSEDHAYYRWVYWTFGINAITNLGQLVQAQASLTSVAVQNIQVSGNAIQTREATIWVPEAGAFSEWSTIFDLDTLVDWLNAVLDEWHPWQDECLLLDQTTPQTVTGGKPEFAGGINCTGDLTVGDGTWLFGDLTVGDGTWLLFDVSEEKVTGDPHFLTRVTFADAFKSDAWRTLDDNTLLFYYTDETLMMGSWLFFDFGEETTNGDPHFWSRVRFHDSLRTPSIFNYDGDQAMVLEDSGTVECKVGIYQTNLFNFASVGGNKISFFGVTAVSQQAHIADAATDAAEDAGTDLSESYSTANFGDVDSALATIAARVNSIATKYNALAGKYNGLARDHNTALAQLEAYGLFKTA